jgi:transcription antitermination factor NusG
MATRNTDILDLGSWCILGADSPDTLRAAASLRAAGFKVWTPIEKRVAKMPRTGASFDKDRALTPGYIFAHVGHVNELLRLAMMPNRRHPRFWVFHHKGGIPLIADSELNALRGEEERKRGVFDRWRRKGMKGPKLARHTQVRMPEGPFAGLSGIVEDTEGQFTLVSVEGFFEPIKVASCLLLENMAQDGLPHQRAA